VSIIETFRNLESNGFVRLRADEEQESYFDVFGNPTRQRSGRRSWTG